MKITKNITLFLLIISLQAVGAPNYVSNINGVKGDVFENTKKRVSEIESLLTEKSTQEEIERIYRKSQIEIKESLKPYGFFTPNLSSSMGYNKKKKTWVANFHITPGTRIRIQSTDIQIFGDGKNDPKFRDFIKNFPLAKNHYLNTEMYKESKQKLLDLAAAHGYFNAKLEKNAVEINMKTNKANIILHLNTGKRFRFGCVTFERTEHTKKPLKTEFLQSFIPFKKGDYYEQKSLHNLQQNLSSSQYFQTVIVQPHHNNKDGNTIPITVKLTPRKGKQYNFGLGYGTDTGPRGLAGVELRRLTETGHYFTGEVRASFGDNSPSGVLNMSYNIPGINPAKDLFKFTLEADQDKDDDYGLSRSTRLSGSYISEIAGWQQTLGVTWQWERSEPEDELPFTSSIIIPNGTWQRVISDDPLHPTNGYKLNFSLRGSSKLLLSDTSFVQARAYGKYLHSFNDNFMVLLRAEIGGILIDDLDDLPLSLRFFAGGSNSVRGYGYRNIKDGRTIGIGSIELQHRIYDKIFGAVFFDAGNVSSNLFGNYDKSVGIGLVYRSLIGSISLTVAQALDKPGQPRRVEFSMGPDL